MNSESQLRVASLERLLEVASIGSDVLRDTDLEEKEIELLGISSHSSHCEMRFKTYRLRKAFLLQSLELPPDGLDPSSRISELGEVNEVEIHVINSELRGIVRCQFCVVLQREQKKRKID